MARMTVTGVEEFANKLGILASKAHEINRGALGEGAGYAADQIRAAASSIPTISEAERESGKHAIYGATENELAQILSNLGIKTFSEGGGKISTQIGFGGYVNTHSPKFGDRVPTGMLLQVINNGAAGRNGANFRAGTHVLDKVANQIKGPVQQKIQDYIDDKVKDIIN